MQGKQPTEVSLYSGRKGEKYNPKEHGEDVSRFVHVGSVVKAKNPNATAADANANGNKAKVPGEK